jgi:hypothetical protein
MRGILTGALIAVFVLWTALCAIATFNNYEWLVKDEAGIRALLAMLFWATPSAVVLLFAILLAMLQVGPRPPVAGN